MIAFGRCEKVTREQERGIDTGERTRDENKGKAHIEIDIYVGCYI